MPDTASDTCLVRIGETDGEPVDVSDAVFTIAAPSSDYIMVTSPNGGEAWTVDSSKNITWTTTGTVGIVKIDYSIDGGSN